jgi:hypothetical protein
MDGCAAYVLVVNAMLDCTCFFVVPVGTHAASCAMCLLAGSQDSAGSAAAAALREVRVWGRRLLLALLLALPVAVLSMLAMHPHLQQKLEGPHGLGHQGDAAAAAASGGTAGPAEGVMSSSSAASMSAGGMQGAAAYKPAAGPLPGKAVGGLPILWIVQLILATGGCWDTHYPYALWPQLLRALSGLLRVQSCCLLPHQQP